MSSFSFVSSSLELSPELLTPLSSSSEVAFLLCSEESLSLPGDKGEGDAGEGDVGDGDAGEGDAGEGEEGLEGEGEAGWSEISVPDFSFPLVGDSGMLTLSANLSEELSESVCFNLEGSASLWGDLGLSVFVSNLSANISKIKARS